MTDENRIRMGRGDHPESEIPDAREQGPTIVGGRPAGASAQGRNIPRAMELLIKKAAVDSSFLPTLLAKREKAGVEVGLSLDPAEQLMLKTIPESQLRAIVAGTAVPESQRKVLAGGSTAAIVALLAQLSFAPVAARAEGANPEGTPGQEQVQLASGPKSSDAFGSLGKGGARADNDLNKIPPIGSRPVIVTPTYQMAPGGARPDFDGHVKGIRPDFPVLTPVPPVPEPVPASPEKEAPTPDGLSRRIVQSELSGLTVGQALHQLEAEVGWQFSFQSDNPLGKQNVIQTSTKGLALDAVLRDMAAANTPGAGAEFVFVDQEVRVIVKEGSGSVPPAIKPPRPPVNNDDHPISRGIRPDMPKLPDRP